MITVENVSKTIKGKTILSNISFEIATGDCLALIGPNGAGKTTLMSCLLGDLKISKGSILLDNLSPRNRHLKEMIAVLPQENVLPQKLKVCELIDFSSLLQQSHYQIEKLIKCCYLAMSKKNS